ncbi:DUF7344 domain-containing protein [Halorientalis halophila]|uniref:DUF7344 domain-containing protein n=1 Tax=Halorientalis halophila TaxID=3108499 RepID=UPI00300A7C9B
MPTTEPNSNPGREGALSTTTVCGLLSNERRLRTLQHLSRAVGAVAIPDLADHLALAEGEHTREHVERVCTSLVHVHVPKLTDAGVVEYDSDEETLQLLPAADVVAPYLDLAARETRSPRSDGSKSKSRS